ncbi:ABC transporter permease [Oceanobacillus jeddahense]|uniref:ABC transporter permease n=1 Tax=Oceanobacillus jeddahense TaxID=1462527 RepID=A0ABY5JX90_9BACI|nr:ABC transporter permease [Oceanobacillus jeddahense]UUI04420.1 ABC transporter permease [Oceanobacillus jeddahense]
MLALMKLELRKHNIRTYIISAFALFVVMLGFIYLFAYVPQFDPNDADLYLFAGYHNIIPLFGVINMTVFCVLAAVMHSRFIIEEYTEKRVIRLFSYPVKRGSVFFSKVMVVSLFTIITMSLCNIFIFSIFGLSEWFAPLVDERITASFILEAVKTTILMSISAAGLSIIAMGIGFIQKSVPTTIISAVLLCSIFCNIVAGSLSSSDMPVILAILLAILCGILIIGLVSKKINRMEA